VARRFLPIENPVTLAVDGDAVTAVEDEPVAMALAASGRLVLGRSVKYHRPRGAVCYSGNCDGCLMRVDGVGSVMTCRVPSRDGMVIETQNVIGSAETDLLAVTDWFFPEGLDHHTMFTRFRSLNQVMQKVARRIAGIGTLPDHAHPPVDVVDRSCDVLVIGGGAAGLIAAAECSARGLSVILVEESNRFGGSLRSYPGWVRAEQMKGDAVSIAARLEAEARKQGAVLDASHAAIGVYGSVVAVDTSSGLQRIALKRLVVATGAREGASAIAGSDLPGVIHARGAALLLEGGILPGEDVALVGVGSFADAIETALTEAGGRVAGRWPLDAIESISGGSQVSSVMVRAHDKAKRVRCDAVVLAPHTTAVYELAGQAGVPISWQDGRFVVQGSSADGRTDVGSVRAVGDCTAVKGLDAVVRQASSAAAQLAQELAPGLGDT